MPIWMPLLNLPVVKGSSYEKVKEFYEKASQSFDALETLGKSDMLKGFVLSTLNKLPNINQIWCTQIMNGKAGS